MPLMIVCWLLVGLSAGMLGKLVHPSLRAKRVSFAILVGILGSMFGGSVSRFLQLGEPPFSSAGWILAIFGAVILLSIGSLGTLFVPSDRQTGVRDRNLGPG